MEEGITNGKGMTMGRKDYRRVRCFFNTCSIGMFGEHVYAFEQLTGSCDVPEYHQITKEEYETVDRWIRDDCRVMEILRRPVLCDGYGNGQFDEEEAMNSLWGNRQQGHEWESMVIKEQHEDIERSRAGPGPVRI